MESNSGAPLTLLQCQKKLWTDISKLHHDEVKRCAIAEGQEKEDDTQVQDGDYKLMLLPSREKMCQSALQGVKEFDSRMVESVNDTVNLITTGCDSTIQEELRSTALKRTKMARCSQQGKRKTRKPQLVASNDGVTSENNIFDDLPIPALSDPIVELSLREIDDAFSSETLVEFDDDILSDIMQLIDQEELEFEPDILLNDDNGSDENVIDNSPVAANKTVIDFESVLDRLKFATSKNKWTSVTNEEFQTFFSSAESHLKLTVEELKVIYKHLTSRYPSLPPPRTKPHVKAEFINILSLWCSDGSQLEVKDSKQRKCTGEVASMTAYLCSLRKSQLAIIIATLKWPSAITDWKNKQVFLDGCLIKSGNDSIKVDQWFTQPEEVQGSVVASCCDFHHINTNTRCHVCRKGYPGAGIHREAYLKIARQEKHNMTGLTLAHVEDVVGPQDSSKAELMFSTEVQAELVKMGHENEAAFNERMRNWQRAVDERGISAFQRIEYLFQMRTWLLTFLREVLSTFPPPTTHVNSIPIQNFEGLLISCERIPLLYQLIPKGNFNVRSLGSQMNETFFSAFAELDSQRRYKGVLKPSEVPKAMSRACKLLELRMDPTRKFAFVTKRNQIYPEREFESETKSSPTNDGSTNSSELKQTLTAVDVISLMDNPYFDTPTNRQRKRKSGKISRPEEPAHGMLGVRQYHRSDDTHVLAHIRAGMCNEDVS